MGMQMSGQIKSAIGFLGLGLILVILHYILLCFAGGVGMCKGSNFPVQ
jgi:hypothetical protein